MGSVRERYSRNVIPSEAEGSFWHTGIAPYVRQRKRGKPFAKEARKSRVQGRFLDCARNDGMRMDGSPYAPCLIIILLIEFIYAFFARFL